jgi:hypothetical protein
MNVWTAIGCVLCVFANASSWAQCSTRLPVQLLEECIEWEGEGRLYPSKDRLEQWEQRRIGERLVHSDGGDALAARPRPPVSAGR